MYPMTQQTTVQTFQPDATLAAEIANIGVIVTEKPVAKRGRKTNPFYDNIASILLKLPLGTMLTLNKSFDSYDSVQRVVGSLKLRTIRHDANLKLGYTTQQKEGPGGSIHWSLTLWINTIGQ